MGGLSIWHWIIVLVVVLLVFGTKRLRNAGKDLGEAVKGFKEGVSDPDKPASRLSDERSAEPGDKDKDKTEAGRDGAQH